MGVGAFSLPKFGGKDAAGRAVICCDDVSFAKLSRSNIIDESFFGIQNFMLIYSSWIPKHFQTYMTTYMIWQKFHLETILHLEFHLDFFWKHDEAHHFNLLYFNESQADAFTFTSTISACEKAIRVELAETQVNDVAVFIQKVLFQDAKLTIPWQSQMLFHTDEHLSHTWKFKIFCLSIMNLKKLLPNCNISCTTHVHLFSKKHGHPGVIHLLFRFPFSFLSHTRIPGGPPGHFGGLEMFHGASEASTVTRGEPKKGRGFNGSKWFVKEGKFLNRFGIYIYITKWSIIILLLSVFCDVEVSKIRKSQKQISKPKFEWVSGTICFELYVAHLAYDDFQHVSHRVSLNKTPWRWKMCWPRQFQNGHVGPK